MLCAITSGLAPARFADTLIVGKSTCGSGATGSEKNAAIPASARPIVSRIVRDRPPDEGCRQVHGALPGRCRGRAHAPAAPRERLLAAIEIEVDDRGGEHRQQLADQQAAEDRDAERPAQFRPLARCRPSAAPPRTAPPASSSGSGGSAGSPPGGSPRRGGSPSSRSAAIAKSIIMIAFFLTMPISSTMPMMPMTSRSCPVTHKRQQRADAGRRQGRQDRHRVDEALVEHAQHDIDADDRREDQVELVGERAWRMRPPRRGRSPRCRP